MSLVSCPECGKSISDKARFCPNCGLPMGNQTIIGRAANAVGATINKISKQLDNPVESADVQQLSKDLIPLPANFSGGTRVNGIGTTTGGYVGIPGIPGYGIVRRYFSIFFIPVILLDLYVVKDWKGNGGIYIGRISTINARKYVNLKKQILKTIILSVQLLMAFIIVILIVAALSSSFS
jgi:hypothetical protein